MTEKELNVPSVELCQRLKEAGLPQEGWMWYWVKPFPIVTERDILITGERLIEYRKDKTEDFLQAFDMATLAAPTLGVMGEWIAKVDERIPTPDPEDYAGHWLDDFDNETLGEADARAEMLLELHKRGIINLKDCKP